MSCLHKNSSGIRSKLKQDDDFEGQTCKIQEVDIVEELSDIKFSDKSHEFVKRFCSLGGFIGAREGSFDRVFARLSHGIE